MARVEGYISQPATAEGQTALQLESFAMANGEGVRGLQHNRANLPRCPFDLVEICVRAPKQKVARHGIRHGAIANPVWESAHFCLHRFDVIVLLTEFA